MKWISHQGAAKCPLNEKNKNISQNHTDTEKCINLWNISKLRANKFWKWHHKKCTSSHLTINSLTKRYVGNQTPRCHLCRAGFLQQCYQETESHIEALPKERAVHWFICLRLKILQMELKWLQLTVINVIWTSWWNLDEIG